MSGIYCAIYLLTIGSYTSSHFLPGYQIVYATFTALPIYFTAGAKREEFFQYIGSYLVGVVWAMIYLFIMDRLATTGIPAWANIALVVAVICIVECAIHFCLPASLPFNKVPAHFGAISNSFWCSNMSIAILGGRRRHLGGRLLQFHRIPHSGHHPLHRHSAWPYLQ